MTHGNSGEMKWMNGPKRTSLGQEDLIWPFFTSFIDFRAFLKRFLAKISQNNPYYAKKNFLKVILY